ncbi:glycosyl transferase, partial [Oceanospirillaceae bacterium]|nr:glycosyl transferase [Oceanospirillaceae bacterium]
EQTCHTQIWQRHLIKRDTLEQKLDPDRLRLLWQGKQHDNYGEAAVISTLASCLVLLGKAKEQLDAIELATKWWENRNKQLMR